MLTHELDRLPTVSAAEALEGLADDSALCVSTGLPELDARLSPHEPGVDGSQQRGGVQRGQLTEVWGPPGVGKTAIG